MFNLDEQIAKWRQELAGTGLAPEILNELEEHLREDIERQVRGVGAPEAFQVAVGRIGPARALKREFNRVRRPGVVATLRRHKWKLVICSGAGLLAALGLYALRPAEYQSEAKLFVRYITEGRAAFPDQKHAAIMQTEKEILSSLGLARQVARTIGPETILRTIGGGDDLNKATSAIIRGLSVSVPPNSSVIHITFRHPDPKLLQPILREVVATYLRMHADAKRSAAMDGVSESKATIAFGSGLSVSVPPNSSVIHIAVRHPDPKLLQPILREVVATYLRMHADAKRAAGMDGVSESKAGKVSNIISIQDPSGPFFDSTKARRGLPAIFALGVFAGFAWVLIAARFSDSKLRPAS